MNPRPLPHEFGTLTIPTDCKLPPAMSYLAFNKEERPASWVDISSFQAPFGMSVYITSWCGPSRWVMAVAADDISPAP